MSFTVCEFSGKFSEVDGTSYACVIALALMEAAEIVTTTQQKIEWLTKLHKLRDDTLRYPSNMIGGDLAEFVGDSFEDKKTFIRALQFTESKIRAFDGTIPNSFLKQSLGLGSGVDYIQEIDYRRDVFVRTIRELQDLLAT